MSRQFINNLVIFAFLVFISAAAFLAWEDFRTSQTHSVCEKPINYKIGSFDRRFGVSYQNFLAAIEQAESIWESHIGKELFTYNPELDGILVNLIYDYRQEATDTLSFIGHVLEQNESDYQALQAEYFKLKNEYDSAKGVYDTKVASFDSRTSAFQAQVEAWNQSPRTSKSQFNRLEKENTALEVEAAELRTLENRINGMAREINLIVGKLNQLATSLDLGVEVYNTVGASRGESFTGGLYYSDDNGTGIDIYEFSSSGKLVQILTHELGHALGLEHNDDPKAVMYYLNKDDIGVLSVTDLEQLQALCGVK